MNYELFKGLPLRTITAEDKQGVEHTFGVTTDTVNDLIVDSLQCVDRLDGSVEEFDNSYSYSVPQDLFEYLDDNELIVWINENIDDNFKIE